MKQNLQPESESATVDRGVYVLPASFGQQRLWFLNQLQRSSSFYHISAVIRMKGSLNAEVLSKSLNEIVARHEVLRTTLATEAEKLVQIIAPESAVPLPVIDLTSVAPEQHDETVQRLAVKKAEEPFELERGPLLRTTLIRLGEEDHVLLLIMHHIVSDGWSIGIFLEELTALYRAFAAGQPSPLPPLRVQYADFAQWQRELFNDGRLKDQTDYWRRQLGDLPARLELPTDRPRPAVQTFQGARKRVGLPGELGRRLKELSRQEGVTLFMTLLAAFQTLLHRYSGSDDIFVGSPIANRNRSEIEGLIGFFVNTLVMRTDFSGNPTFRELLQRVREVALQAYSYQDVPFDKLVDELKPERSLSYSPLFQVAFALEKSTDSLKLPGLSLEWIDIDRGTSKFDLALFVFDGADELSCLLEYDTDLFAEATIARMLDHFRTLLQSIVENPEQAVSQLPMLTAAERTQVLTQWNRTDMRVPRNLCVHVAFERQVEQMPENLAVGLQDKKISYKELNARANKLAHYLRKEGVGPEVLVGVCLERSIEMVIGLLGILKAGGAYLPLDPVYPSERLFFMLQNSGAKMLLTQRHQPLPEQVPPTICLDSDWNLIEPESSENPENPADANNLVYVIYTSGSTGPPKGVQITHRSLLNLVHWHNAFYRITAADRASLIAGVSFDASAWELWPYLLAGSSVHIPDDETRLTPDLLRDWLLTNEITTTFLPTPLAERVLSLPWPEKSKLGTMLIGGDRLRQYPSPSLPFSSANNYGPTEATVVTTAVLLPQREQSKDVPPIGSAISNAKVYLLDGDMQPVPPGVAGELYVGGRGLARGYLRDAASTAEKFVPNPFSDERGARLYRTGDLARYRVDAQIQFIGRVDHQIKIRGYRIEPGEIETVFAKHRAVSESVVIAPEDGTGAKRLVAFVVTKNGAGTTTEELRQYLRERLPDYMVPSVIVLLDALPLTPNGKVDREALPVDRLAVERGEEFVAPRTPIESALAEIWSEVLGLDVVGVHDNFFELGGDSILSIQIIARANRVGLRLTPKQIFQHQTIAELACVAGTAKFVQAEQGLVTGPVPLTPVQHWFFEQNLPDLEHFNQAMLIEVGEALDPSLLEAALSHIQNHHDALRLRFVKDGSEWQQENAGPENSVPLVRFDLSGESEASQAATMSDAFAQLQSSLNLATGPLWRVALFEFGPEKPARLFIVVHHLAIDGVSWRILIEDLELACSQLRDDKPIKLPSKTTSFKQWAELLRQYAQSAELAAERAYWLSAASNDVAPLPVELAAGENLEQSAETVAASLTVAETRALLQDVPAAHSTQINDVLLAAFAQAFTKWTGDSRLLIDLEGHGREEIIDGVDLSRTVGWFTTIFPVLLDLAGEGDSARTLQRVREQLQRVPNRGIGFGLLRFLSDDEELIQELKTLPGPEVSLNYLGQFAQERSQSLLSPVSGNLGRAHSPRQPRKHLIDINGWVTNGQLTLEWSYSTNIHRKETIETLSKDFISALRRLIADCQSRGERDYTPSDFPDVELDQAGLDQVLAELDLAATEDVEDGPKGY